MLYSWFLNVLSLLIMKNDVPPPVPLFDLSPSPEQLRQIPYGGFAPRFNRPALVAIAVVSILIDAYGKVADVVGSLFPSKEK